NLVINARDAMPHGGKLTIQTANVELDERSAALHGSMVPGAYVLLTVNDTGCGMDEVTKQRLFEPFFTTKEVGKGTGLGLSTAYGIVEQSGGRIEVSSELGQGSTFEIYLPRVADASGPRRRTHDSERPPVGNETILLVEDDQAVRALATRILRAAGYAVLAAAGGAEAVQTFETHAGEIALLLTDVVMPQMSGKQLAETLSQLHPSLRVLYMSGYTDNAIQRHGALEPGTMFIGKPFDAKDLTRKVRDVLDAGVPDTAPPQDTG
ncbi:MAG TPA: ATP-binding protein, partial [Polyangiales bacterium]